MEEILKEILGELKTLNQRVGKLEEGQGKLGEGQTRLEESQRRLEEGHRRLEEGHRRLEEGHRRLEEGHRRLEENQARLESKVDRLELRMENEVIDKIRALFDGWQEHEEKFIDVAEKIDLLNLKFDRLETKLNQVAIVQKDHSEILDLLAARSIRQEADIQTLKRAK
ncbi:hypothetical protein P378_11000 [Desulforamulus profundi]|uniref:Uncharacterized protein n=1 Tax=Desulforamulus profundi TaxID=1383067 RepID=A0A2C6L2K6_9FIRM|nr:hypothetical protein [Desulforamulus profundi]PHJ38351.1 hypothetical protein P378_11000 [Desulforamulus profundi]